MKRLQLAGPSWRQWLTLHYRQSFIGVCIGGEMLRDTRSAVLATVIHQEDAKLTGVVLLQ